MFWEIGKFRNVQRRFIHSARKHLTITLDNSVNGERKRKSTKKSSPTTMDDESFIKWKLWWPSFPRIFCGAGVWVRREFAYKVTTATTIDANCTGKENIFYPSVGRECPRGEKGLNGHSTTKTPLKYLLCVFSKMCILFHYE